jgi:signal transduction histidine kinase/CheY-like chemotaxis protein/HPt (histidine-containing phosphotransfer) domain-containing protein
MPGWGAIMTGLAVAGLSIALWWQLSLVRDIGSLHHLVLLIGAALSLMTAYLLHRPGRTKNDPGGASSGEYLTHAMNSIGGGYFIVDPDLNFVTFSEKVHRMYDLPDHIGVPGSPLADMIEVRARRGDYGEGDIDQLIAERLQRYRTLKPRIVEDHLGGLVYEIVRERASDGSVIAIFHDITSRSEWEAEIKYSRDAMERERHRLRDAIEALDVGFIMYDADERLVVNNKRFAEMYELVSDLLVPGRTFEEILREGCVRSASHEKSGLTVDEWVEDRLARLRNREKGVVAEIGGRWILINNYSSADGGVVSIRTDVTDLKNTETDLANRTQVLQAVMGSMAQGIVAFGADLKLQAWNDRFLKIRGYPEELAKVGTDFETFMQYDVDHREFDLDTPEVDVQNQIERARRFEPHAFERQRPNGSYVEVRGGPIPGGGFVSTYTDVTDRKSAEQDLMRARDAAEAASEAKANFLASMSHEIRTPMNGVLGMADLLSQTELDEDQRQILDTILDSGNSLLTIINDILDFSKMEAGKLSIESVPLFLENVIEGAAATLAPNADRKGVRIISFVDPALPGTLLGDPVRLRQIVFNLTGNAVKFSEQGEVIVRADLLSEGADDVTVRISVSDHGIGISDDALEGLFEAFSQAENSTTRRFGGTGLGLTICRHITEMMNGEISVDSKIGSGSTFKVEVSLKKTDDKFDTNGEDLKGLDVLLVTSSKEMADVMTTYLQGRNAGTILAGGDLEALEAAQGQVEAGSPFDVAVIDFDRTINRDVNIVERLSDQQINSVVLGKGRRRSARIESTDRVDLDSHPLYRQRLINAVAVAVGRASPLVKTDLQDEDAGDAVLPTVDEALEAGTLILLAEDNPTNRQVIGRQLNKLGYVCEMADDGKQALAAWHSKNYALLLTDCHMPYMDGFELTAAVREAEKGVDHRAPIIAVTANALEGEAERCIAAGMDDYLSKPLAMVDLKNTLKKWMPKGTNGDIRNETNAGVGSSSRAVSETASTVVGSVVDPKFLRETFGDDEETIREIMQDYVDPASQTVGEIDNAYDAHNAEQIGAAGHKLKSASRSIGADGLADICARLEAAGKADDWAEIERNYKQLAPMFESVLAEVKAM